MAGQAFEAFERCLVEAAGGAVEVGELDGEEVFVGFDTLINTTRGVGDFDLQEAALDWLITDARRQDLARPSPQQKAMAELLGSDLALTPPG